MPWNEPAGNFRDDLSATDGVSTGLRKELYGNLVRVASVDEFDEIEFQAARTGNHVRAAVRMSKLAAEAEPRQRAEAHLRAGEQWMMADDSQRAAEEFTAALEDGGPTFADPRVYLARALLALGRDTEAESLLSRLTAERDKATPRSCDLLAELLTEQGDLQGALEWATAGVERCFQRGDDAELALLLRLRYRIRVDLGLDEDDYDRMLDVSRGEGVSRGDDPPEPPVSPLRFSS
jgi:tetratricopeptide (TPR) repeat protein